MNISGKRQCIDRGGFKGSRRRVVLMEGLATKKVLEKPLINMQEEVVDLISSAGIVLPPLSLLAVATLF